MCGALLGSPRPRARGVVRVMWARARCPLPAPGPGPGPPPSTPAACLSKVAFPDGWETGASLSGAGGVYFSVPGRGGPCPSWGMRVAVPRDPVAIWSRAGHRDCPAAQLPPAAATASPWCGGLAPWGCGEERQVNLAATLMAEMGWLVGEGLLFQLEAWSPTDKLWGSDLKGGSLIKLCRFPVW